MVLVMDLNKEINECEMRFNFATVDNDQYKMGYYKGMIGCLTALKNNTYGPDDKPEYLQATEKNEYRYIDADWLDKIAAGLTAGANKYGEGNWRTIPANEHAARAMRHLNLYRAGNESDDHLINASMRCMMAYVVDRDKTTQTKLEGEYK